MGHFPAILKESNAPDAPSHIGGILSFMMPLCETLSDDETDIRGWISRRNWTPHENFCSLCIERYQQGLAWQTPSARHPEEPE